MFTFCTLFSGSSGNCCYLGTERGGLLIDCGMSGSQTLGAMAQAGIDPASVRAILITHDHSDHTKGAGILSRRLGAPIYATRGTWQGMEKAVGELPKSHRVVIDAGESFFLGDIEAYPFPTPHDAIEPVGYRFFIRGHGVAVATDLGYFSQGVFEAVSGAEVVLLESNHDPELLKKNPNYPQMLKTRILGKKGHLSNEACGEAAVRLLETGTRHVLLGHLSRDNNTPELAYRMAHAALTGAGAVVGEDVTLNVAARDHVSHIYIV